MPLVRSAASHAVGENIGREQAAGKPPRQALAIALDTQRRALAQGGGVLRFDDGGGVNPPANMDGNPQLQQLYQRYASLPMAQLQQLAVRTPQTSPQGQLIQRALKAKQMNPAASGAFPTPAPAAGAQAPTQVATGMVPPPNARGGVVRRYDGGGGVASGFNNGDGFQWLESPTAPQSGGGFPTTGSSGGFPPAPTGWSGRGGAGRSGAPSGFPMPSRYGSQGFRSMNPATAPASSGAATSGGTSYQRAPAYGAAMPMMSFSAGQPGEVGPTWSPGHALLSPSSAITTAPSGFGGTPAAAPLLTQAPSGAPVTQAPAAAPAPAPQLIPLTGIGAWARGGTIPPAFAEAKPLRLRASRHLAMGGLGVAPTPEQMGMYASRRGMGELYHPGGFLNSPVAGRTDHLPLAVPAESHVIPADVVSGIGQGNSLNGASQLDQMFHSGPWGVNALTSKAPSLTPKAPRPATHLAAGGPPFANLPARSRSDFASAKARASGGTHERTTSILAAGGEYVVRPEAVAEMGRRAKRLRPQLRHKSDLAAGHDAIDDFILRARKRTVAVTRKLPGPVRG
ncbi:MAG: hypothetical protein ACLQJR_09970 [Stellaceae bacterium]